VNKNSKNEYTDFLLPWKAGGNGFIKLAERMAQEKQISNYFGRGALKC
jgi:hypothetical protein